MIDIHCHILPGVDDGPSGMDESVEMCRIAASDGIKTIVATPHFNIGFYETPSSRIFEILGSLNRAIREKGIDLRIVSGSDVAVAPDLPTYLKKEEYLTINRSRYFLAEFPHESVPPNWDSFLYSMLQAGYVPVITHPERNRWFLNNPDALFPVVKRGILVQVTAMSITGEFGEDIRDCSLYLLERNLVSVIATDAHSSDYRTPLLSEAVKVASDIIGKDRADVLVSTTPSAILEDRPVQLPRPVEKTPKKRWFQWMTF